MFGINVNFKSIVGREFFVWSDLNSQKNFNHRNNVVGLSFFQKQRSLNLCKINEKLDSHMVWRIKYNKKSLVAHVSGCRTSTMSRISLQFISADRYDPEEAFTYLGHVLKLHRKIFLATQSLGLYQLTLLFGSQQVKIEPWTTLHSKLHYHFLQKLVWFENNFFLPHL